MGSISLGRRDQAENTLRNTGNQLYRVLPYKDKWKLYPSDEKRQNATQTSDILYQCIQSLIVILLLSIYLDNGYS